MDEVNDFDKGSLFYRWYISRHRKMDFKGQRLSSITVTSYIFDMGTNSNILSFNIFFTSWCW